MSKRTLRGLTSPILATGCNSIPGTMPAWDMARRCASGISISNAVAFFWHAAAALETVVSVREFAGRAMAEVTGGGAGAVTEGGAEACRWVRKTPLMPIRHT